MAADNAPQLLSMAQQFTGLPMDSLIGGPLNAAATANASMAMTQTKFMLDTCFTADADNSFKPVMIKMSLTRGLITVDPATGENKVVPFTTAFDLPLLTIVPINSLGVDEVDITFEMEVKSSFGNTQSAESNKEMAAKATLEAKFSIGPFSCSITGSASYSSSDKSSSNSHYEASNSAKYTVHVHAAQLPVPKGVNTIIQAFTDAISPYDPATPKT